VVLPLETHPSRPRSPNAEIKTTRRKGGGTVGAKKKEEKKKQKQKKREKARKKELKRALDSLKRTYFIGIELWKHLFLLILAPFRDKKILRKKLAIVSKPSHFTDTLVSDLKAYQTTNEVKKIFFISYWAENPVQACSK
jgi:hypothetical protein